MAGTGQRRSWECSNPLKLSCTHHGEEREVPCGRWRTCIGCGMRKQWEIRQRFVAGTDPANVPAGLRAMFFTLTFAKDKTEAEAQAAWRQLVGRLRYRDMLGAYGWVLQRSKAGRLHFHGIAHMPWQNDGLELWRDLITASDFGVQNKLEVANPAHAGYCARYIARNLAEVEPLRRAFSFSQDFPQTAWKRMRPLLLIKPDEPVRYDELPPMPDLMLDALEPFGVEEEADTCHWRPQARA